VFSIDPKQGHVADVRSTFDPNGGRKMKARPDKHVNHSHNDHSAQSERQADPHSHAVILDSYFGRIAFVPDLGMDVIRQFRYDPEGGSLTPAGMIRSGPPDPKALGPRYMDFHPTLPMCYVVNELSNDVSVFAFDLHAAEQLLNSSIADLQAAQQLFGNSLQQYPVLRLVQTIKTIPDGFDDDLNTCGRITVHAAGNFVLVSNRGHDSIAVFRVQHAPSRAGTLSMVGNFHTRGATPRHFAFDASGQWLITVNQDSDRVGVFRFNLATGRLDWTGHEYHVPSPNFVCNVQPHLEEDEGLTDEKPSNAATETALGKEVISSGGNNF
jgi:6-phosphogluconolactonase (cycloisomerase 2 family)